jgi:hypothetical protein
MKRMTITDFRKHVLKTFSKIDEGETFVVTRKDRPSILMSLYTVGSGKEKSWKKPGLRLSLEKIDLSKSILTDTEGAVI